MTGKNILIIEPDEFVSSLINKSFIGYDPNLLVTVSTDPQEIFALLSQKEVEIIIADASYILEQPAIISNLTDPESNALHTILTGYGSLESDYPLKVEGNIHGNNAIHHYC